MATAKKTNCLPPQSRHLGMGFGVPVTGTRRVRELDNTACASKNQRHCVIRDFFLTKIRNVGHQNTHLSRVGEIDVVQAYSIPTDDLAFGRCINYRCRYGFPAGHDGVCIGSQFD